MSTSTAQRKEKTEKEKSYVWTDEETALLVKIVIDYKALKANLGLEWETIKNRYEEITTRFRSSYPTKESGASIEEFPKSDDTSIITKERVCTKIKRIKTSFRKAVDSGRRSGGGRVVLHLYDECYEIWAGSPAVDSIKTGIETNSLENTDVSSESQSNWGDGSSLPPDSNSMVNSDSEKEKEEDEESVGGVPKIKDMGACRRNLLNHLKEKKDAKLTKRISTEAQLLDAAKQEIAIKKRIVESIEDSEKRHEQQIKTFNETMGALTSAIGNGFAMLQGLMQQQMHQPQPYFQSPTRFMGQQSFSGQQFNVNSQPGNGENQQVNCNNSQQNSYKSYLDDDNF